MKSDMTIAQALILTLKNYRVGASYEPLVDVMRDLAVVQYEEFEFADGSSLSIQQEDRQEDGTFAIAKVNTDDPEHSVLAGDEGE
jgi:hypothetical protein